MPIKKNYLIVYEDELKTNHVMRIQASNIGRAEDAFWQKTIKDQRKLWLVHIKEEKGQC